MRSLLQWRQRKKNVCSPSPGPRTRPGNQVEDSQCGMKAAIHSGKLCFAPPKCQTPRGGDGQSGEEVTAPTLSWLHGEVGHGGLREFLGGEDSFSHYTSTSCFSDLQLCLQLGPFS